MTLETKVPGVLSRCLGRTPGGRSQLCIKGTAYWGPTVNKGGLELPLLTALSRERSQDCCIVIVSLGRGARGGMCGAGFLGR